MNETGTRVATPGPRISARGVILTAVAGVGVAVGVLFATGAFDDDSDSTTSTGSAANSSASAVAQAEVAAAEHQAAISEIELRNIELKQVFQEQPASAVASPATLEGKQQRLDAAGNEAFCQSCFDQWKADQLAQQRADQRMADKLAQMDAYDAAFGLR